VQTALYYLLYINPDYQENLSNKEMIEQYFEKFYFARKKFLVNFLSRKQGLRWNGRFKKLFDKYKKEHVVHMIKNANQDSKKMLMKDFEQKEMTLEKVKRAETYYMTEREKEQDRKKKSRNEIKKELDNIFNPLINKIKVSN